jgi:hypothetical protein
MSVWRVWLSVCQRDGVNHAMKLFHNIIFDERLNETEESRRGQDANFASFGNCRLVEPAHHVIDKEFQIPRNQRREVEADCCRGQLFALCEYDVSILARRRNVFAWSADLSISQQWRDLTEVKHTCIRCTSPNTCRERQRMSLMCMDN